MRIAALFAALALAACQTPCPAPDSEPVIATYNCADGSDLMVTFTPNTARVQQEGYVTLDLPARSTGSGYRYSEGGTELRGRRSETRWTRPGAAETVCRAVP